MNESMSWVKKNESMNVNVSCSPVFVHILIFTENMPSLYTVVRTLKFVVTVNESMNVNVSCACVFVHILIFTDSMPRSL